MSGFSFLDDELHEAAGVGASAAAASGKRPPAQWSAARTKSRFEEDSMHSVADRAGPAGGGGGGGGPSLPFRIREVQIVPKAIGTNPVFAVSKPRLKEA
mmetsp:Transcript_110955/g.357948  ORF Transcript_110955/g.357948 Transcript_110955/m.357948 type:complete len:99 (+) Transcript_110955:84-380(+)